MAEVCRGRQICHAGGEQREDIYIEIAMVGFQMLTNIIQADMLISVY